MDIKVNNALLATVMDGIRTLSKVLMEVLSLGVAGRRLGLLPLV